MLVVLGTILLSSFFIHNATQAEFQKFLQEKDQQRIVISQNGSIQVVQDSNLPRWRIERDSPEERFLQATDRALFAVGVIGIVGSVLVGFLLSRFLLLRIERLRDAMRTYKVERKFTKIGHNFDDEIDELTESYNHLAENLERQDTVRKDFFVDLSHEIRTPITSVRGYLEGLLDGVFIPSAEMYEKMLREIERMSHLVRELSSLAKLESGEMSLEKESIDMRQITEGVKETLQDKAEKYKKTITIIGEGHAYVDMQKWNQVLINLVDNAISYSDQNSNVIIELGSEKKKSTWRLTNKAKDLDEGAMNAIFERFYRADKSRKRDEKEPHLGIGLSIVKKIIAAHGGKITAQKRDEEITFEIIVPTM